MLGSVDTQSVMIDIETENNHQWASAHAIELVCDLYAYWYGVLSIHQKTQNFGSKINRIIGTQQTCETRRATKFHQKSIATNQKTCLQRIRNETQGYSSALFKCQYSKCFFFSFLLFFTYKMNKNIHIILHRNVNTFCCCSFFRFPNGLVLHIKILYD